MSTTPLSISRAKKYKTVFKGAAILTTFAALYIVTSPSTGKRLVKNASIKGLYNVSGNDCFLNCVLQSLASQESLLEILKLRCSSSTLYATLYELLQKLNSGPGNPITPGSFLNSLEIATNKKLVRSIQQDAQEFLQHLVETLELQKPHTYKWSKVLSFPVDSPFIGTMEQKVQCCQCLAISISYSTATSIQLCLPPEYSGNSNVSLLSLMEADREQHISDYKCDSCFKSSPKHSKTSCIRTVDWKNPPTILQIQLERTSYTCQGLTRNNVSISFPSKLILKNKHHYILRSLITHSGSVTYGHYLCYRLQDDIWWKANDSLITKSSLNEALSQTRSACLLFYEMESPLALD
ncbi:mitochondrial outer membrane anchored ubiquitin C-terminal hydrolase Ubp11 [Schizosaccharomyces pombe]|uniref:Ubiquitin carboxyl-terminal hydrolase 11 n=1 Tax=Schizosaccharomyces pombe (strain 972 / ATCC 24843) TaxID=284812 RepID=UBP11_SCHPO|nr:ubiquitin hydrolase Ubp11 [Schizosaccharomyces pombe]Q9UUD6.1 RecName: Full=Ubiquitin carboxyl-terminal hydrolase 11; AltName: Full=Deubiquitinating enzyme 11; AltName: Full=Ubiquitin thioesterase 11; AltName: Full=Ubiquitin-specific-processing protease 11 [Schizosaccharomyces pombe 972h-]CAB52031.1 ubiquitin C-terminal hydrolase Ubp11 [Schizosaccharomyces pombe]|eukprot:NP_595689.1 ubiquitin hydrolase Ubp11 [Schizosaccharomyces pombe]